MKLAVTGVTGLIGANVATCAIARGHEVIGVAREQSNAGELETAGVAIRRADIRESSAGLRQAFQGADVLIHAAATFSYHEKADELLAIAVRGSQNVLAAAADAGIRRVVLTSSSVVFGYSLEPEIVTGDALIDDPGGEPPYVSAKIAQERAALALANELGLEILFACPTVTIGPTASTLGPSNGMILAYLADGMRSTYPGGCNIVSARDVGSAHVLIAEAGSPNEHYIVGSANLCWSDLHREIGRLTGVGGPNYELSPSLAWAAAYVEEILARVERRAPLSTRNQAHMLGRYYWYDDKRTRALGYAPAPVSEALVETVSWLVASSHVSREMRSQIRLAADVQRFRFNRHPS